MSIKEEALRRYEVCKTCPKKTELLAIEKCKACGCVLFFKVIAPNEKCPLGKW